MTIPLGRFRQPVLVIWGAEDRVIPPRHAEVMSAETHPTNVVVIPETGHVPQIEAGKQFTDAVQRFIGETQT